ncbi:MAG TPA: DUF523 domain-containing protein [Aliiroseovarius sp.]|nr:DUF523 domain-containing protein [Aliiroseovarius sp.]
MVAILVSACLLGKPVRYDGQSVTDLRALLAKYLPGVTLIALCPEVAGGLPTPRPAAEIAPGQSGSDVLDGKAAVRTKSGDDVSAAFVSGAQAARDLALARSCTFALLKESSPSCGVSRLHSGRFDGHKRAGHGVTAAALQRAGLSVFCEHQIAALVQAVRAAR